MSEWDQVTPEDVRRQLELDEQARYTLARFRANKAFMARIHEAYDARLRGEKGTSFRDLKRKHARP